MSWVSAAPVVVLAVFWLVVPGLVMSAACGLRGVVAWGGAPLLSVAVVSISAVLAGWLGVPWGAWVPVVAVLLVVAVALGVRVGLDAVFPKYRSRPDGTLAALRRTARETYVRLCTPRGGFARLPDRIDRLPTTAMPAVSRPREHPDGRWTGPAALVGVVAAVVLGWTTVAHGMGAADNLSQTFDAVFHYSAVAHILDTGNASSLDLGTLTNPMQATAFYPGAWHDLVSLAVAWSGDGGVIAATNATALAVAAVGWPLGCLLLVRQVLGRSVGAALATPVLAVGFTAFPWALMTFGVLWPNLLGVALLPAALAAAVTLAGLARDSTLGRGGAIGLLVVALPTLGLAHPNALFSLAVLMLFPSLWGLVGSVRRRLLTRHFWVPVLGLLATAGAIWLTVWLMLDSPLLAGVRGYDWPAFQTPGEAVWAVLTNSTNNRPDSWTVSVLVVVGLVVALRRPSTSWLVPAHLASGFLYVLSAGQEGDLTAALTGAWYNDSYRLAAMVPVTGVALAAVGVLGLAGLLRAVVVRREPSIPPESGSEAVTVRAMPAAPPSPRNVALRTLPVLLVTVLAVVVSSGMHQDTHATALAGPYRTTTDILLAPGQREFLRRAADMIPPDAVVVANPYTGNSLIYPLADREVLFPHMNGAWTPEMRTVATRLHDAAVDPSVCAAVTATHTGYVLTGTVMFWPWSGAARGYPGLDGLDRVPGFELMADDGHDRLYRITACDPTQVTNP